MVILNELPPGLTRGLPRTDQEAIASTVGLPVRLVEYDEDGRAELEFVDSRGINHSIFVDPRYLRAVDR
jgi:hypothetical protein